MIRTKYRIYASGSIYHEDDFEEVDKSLPYYDDYETIELPNELIDHIADISKSTDEIIKAVAHIGIDWGYGKYELEQKHIDEARKIYEQK